VIWRLAEENRAVHKVQAELDCEKEQKALNREIAELREAQKREIAVLGCEFTERDSGQREELAKVKEGQEALKRQLAESKGWFQTQQEKSMQELVELSRQFARQLANFALELHVDLKRVIADL